jgi:hypothetical protein
MRQHFTAVLLSTIAAGSPAFAGQETIEVASGVCHHQAGEIVSLKGPLRVAVSRDGVTAGSGVKTTLAAAGPCHAPVTLRLKEGS